MLPRVRKNISCVDDYSNVYHIFVENEYGIYHQPFSVLTSLVLSPLILVVKKDWSLETNHSPAALLRLSQQFVVYYRCFCYGTVIVYTGPQKVDTWGWLLAVDPTFTSCTMASIRTSQIWPVPISSPPTFLAPLAPTELTGMGRLGDTSVRKPLRWPRNSWAESREDGNWIFLLLAP